MVIILSQLTQGDLKITEIGDEERQHFPPVSCGHNSAEPSGDIVKKNSTNFDTSIEKKIIILHTQSKN